MGFADKFKNAVSEMAEHEDHTEVQQGVSSEPYPAGPVKLRFVEYIELGKHEKTWQGKTKLVEKCILGFEISSAKIPAREDGSPNMIRITLNKSLSDKSAYYKLFRRMNEDHDVKVFPQLLGNPYRGTIIHNVKGEGADKKVYANLNDPDGVYTIASPSYIDAETEERRVISVPEPTAECRCFVWNYPDKEQWDSLFIDGEWEAREGKPAQSKNIWQNRIKEAKNWTGSPMQELLFGTLDVGDVEKPTKSQAAADPLDDDIPY